LHKSIELILLDGAKFKMMGNPYQQDAFDKYVLELVEP
jgi:hypothetical protein